MEITAYDHVGLRVTDRARSLSFYGSLGFTLDAKNSSDTALEIVNAAGVRLNLILNGEPTPKRDNILLDRKRKWPGYTHAAFIVTSLAEVLDWAKAGDIPITEGPVDWGRRLTCFLRDPDSNVLEFNEMKAPDDAEPYTLVIGQKNYSSWSMRAWLLLKMLQVPFTEITVPLYRPQSRAEVRALGGQTGLVPVLKHGASAMWDTLAIFEHFRESHLAVWPADANDRMLARSLSGEIHSGFNALRAAMPVNTRARGRSYETTPQVQADIARVVEIWTARDGGSPWLFSTFCGADIMFAPIASRFLTYGVDIDGPAGDYMKRLLAHPLVAEWFRLGREETDVIPCLESGGG